ncbi:hypothetical protein BC939DRAFT_433851 [Gamsiella multidivaricata]|uniref:uncharacterized protein n=1 Tax=Gamsiella multidivaricata TaxID=101098 RepID=UPI00221E9030|nr:uncharacterized protein BC939DRAFT_433851 [Gamsiella multidivaricata]KAI7832612.1 hypothetical protein BC939DRAFT_433851 [Gamsiella multidivaricata]
MTLTTSMMTLYPPHSTFKYPSWYTLRPASLPHAPISRSITHRTHCTCNNITHTLHSPALPSIARPLPYSYQASLTKNQYRAYPLPI